MTDFLQISKKNKINWKIENKDYRNMIKTFSEYQYTDHIKGLSETWASLLRFWVVCHHSRACFILSSTTVWLSCWSYKVRSQYVKVRMEFLRRSRCCQNESSWEMISPGIWSKDLISNLGKGKFSLSLGPEVEGREVAGAFLVSRWV